MTQVFVLFALLSVCEVPYEKRWRWATSKAGKHVNELQTINDVIEDL